MINIKVGIK